MQKIVIDACALYGALNRDIILSLAEGNCFIPFWSPVIIGELEEHLPNRIGREKTDKIMRLMKQHFPGASRTDFNENMNFPFKLKDEDDRHVIALAFQIQADAIMTDNTKDFNNEQLAKLGLYARSVDDTVSMIIKTQTDRALIAIREMRLRWKRPSYDPNGLLELLVSKGLSNTAEFLHEHKTGI